MSFTLESEKFWQSCVSAPGFFSSPQKSAQIAEQMLTAHSLRNLFDDVIGTERDGRFAQKGDAVRFI